MRRAEDGPAPEGPKHSGGRPKPGFLPREEGVGHAGEEGRRRRCGTGGPRQTRRDRGQFRAAVDMEEVWHSSDDARQSAPGTAKIGSVLRDVARPPCPLTRHRCQRRQYSGLRRSGYVAWVTDGDMLRLESVSGSGSRRTTPGNAWRSGEMRGRNHAGIASEGPRHGAAPGREVTFHRVGRSRSNIGRSLISG